MLDTASKRIHETAVDKASKYLVAEAELLSAIIAVDRHKLYVQFDEPYLTPYCVKYLNLSEDVAGMFVRVARKSAEVPELEAAVQNGLHMSKARTIASVIDPENKDEWIRKAQTLSKEKLEREVAAANPTAVRADRIKPVGPGRNLFQFEVTDEETEVLKRGLELMSQKKRRHAGIGETIMAAVREWVEREDPVRKAERAQERKEKSQRNRHADSDPSHDHPSRDESESPSNRTEDPWRSKSGHRPAIPAEIRHQVHLRDRGFCRKRMPDGSSCGSRKWTDIHHIIQKAYGGTDTLENLITLCSAHHRQIHERSA